MTDLILFKIPTPQAILVYIYIYIYIQSILRDQVSASSTTSPRCLTTLVLLIVKPSIEVRGIAGQSDLIKHQILDHINVHRIHAVPISHQANS